MAATIRSGGLVRSDDRRAPGGNHRVLVPHAVEAGRRRYHAAIASFSTRHSSGVPRRRRHVRSVVAGGYLRSSAMPMQDDEKETNAVNRTPYTPFAERCTRRHRRTLLTMVAAVLLVTGTVPFPASMAPALPPCPDGPPPPCDLPDPDPGPDDPPPPPPDDPEPPPAPEPECDAPGGFARPVGIVPPGYIYSPTAFGGVVAD